MKRVKAAIIRDEGYPIGKPAPCHINCACGERIPLAKPFEVGATCPKCGIIYDARGWIRPQETEPAEHPADCDCRSCEPEPVDAEERYIHED